MWPIGLELWMQVLRLYIGELNANPGASIRLWKCQGSLRNSPYVKQLITSSIAATADSFQVS